MAGTNIPEVREIGGKVAVDNFDKTFDPISGRYYDRVNSGDYLHRTFSAAVTAGTDGATVSLGNFTVGSRDEVVIDFDAFIGSTGGVAGSATGPTGYVQIDQGGTVLRQFLLDNSLPAASSGSNPLRRVHYTAPSQEEPIMKFDDATTVTVRWVSLGTVNATIHCTFSGPRLSYASKTIPVGSVI